MSDDLVRRLEALAAKYGTDPAKALEILLTTAETVTQQQEVMEETDEEPEIDRSEDAYVKPIVSECGEARDRDNVVPERAPGRCLACERGGARRGAPHTCGLPSPVFAPRSMHG